MIVDYYPDWAWSYSWLLYLGFVFSFFVAFGIGANDCANSYSTVVGAKVLKLWQAYILATIFEVLGAGLLGYSVITTMTKSVVDVEMYTVRSASVNSSYLLSCDNLTTNHNCTLYTEASFGVGELATLISTATWLIFASSMKLPVSSTQATIGATIGFSLVLKGSRGIHWEAIGHIAISWVTSPLLSGIIAISFYVVKNQFEASLKMMPFFYWFALTVNVFAVLYEGSAHLKFDRLAWYTCLGISLAIACTVAAFVWFIGHKWVRKRVIALKEQSRLAEQVRAAEKNKSKNAENGTEIANATANEIQLTTVSLDDNKTKDSTAVQSSESSSHASLKDFIQNFRRPVQEDPLATEVFHYLQILSACFLSFGHGSNDTANSVKALVGIWFIFMNGYVGGAAVEESSTLEYLALFGAVSMVVGLWILGHKVIKTMGKKITEVTALSGFCMELGTAFTVLFASKLGIPISTTECAVGAIMAVGWFKSDKGGISWSLMKTIAIAWLVTMPICGALSALLTYLINFAFK